MPASRTPCRADAREPTLRWLAEQRERSRLSVAALPWNELTEWQLVDGVLRHSTGRYFTIVALEEGGESAPIIVQPEIGILGFLVRRAPDGNMILLQAKTEPGNVLGTQIAPSVQATVSNYMRVHAGAPTLHLDRFLLSTDGQVVSDSLQSEQGTRFFGKYNRNMTVVVERAPPEGDPRYRWTLLRDALPLLTEDYTFNTDARSALVSSDWSLLGDGREPFSRNEGRDTFGFELARSMRVNDGAHVEPAGEVIARLRAIKGREPGEIVPLERATAWRRGEDGLYERQPSSFHVRLFEVHCRDREVERWQQPLLESFRECEVVLLCRLRAGVLHFLFRVSLERGFRGEAQLGPSYHGEVDGPSDSLFEALGAMASAKVHATVRQSDEGGRFYRSVTRYRIIEIDESVDPPASDRDFWLPLRQISQLVQHRGVFTNEARSVLSLLLAFM